MPRDAQFHFSRLLKFGSVTSDSVVAALKDPASIQPEKWAWTVVNIQEGFLGETLKKKYVSGRLAKYDPEAVVEVVDDKTKKVIIQSEPNMQKASSLFVYFPDDAIFVHRHIWNEIRAEDFRVRLAGLVTASLGGFFAECELQPIADMEVFVAKLAKLSQVTELRATVNPPNPMFAPEWKPLRDYIQKRKLKAMTIAETAKKGDEIASTLPTVAAGERQEKVGKKQEYSPGDAAVLMAADGYGAAKVVGKSEGSTVVVKTSDSALKVILPSDIPAEELAKLTSDIYAKTKETRGFRH